ncbi:MAG: hypothetical protein Q9170_005513 [Blastenia crenularia]
MEREMDEEEEGGGFLPERGAEEAVPTARRGRRRTVSDEESEENDVYEPSDVEDAEEDVGTYRQHLSSSRPIHRKPVVPQISRQEEIDSNEEGAGGFIPDDDDTGGGFLPDEDENAGGFLPEDSDEEILTTKNDSTDEYNVEEHMSAPQPDRSAPNLPEKNIAPVNNILEETEERYPAHQAPEILEDIPLHRTLTDAEIEEATMLQEMYESHAANAPPLERLLRQVDNTENEDGVEAINVGTDGKGDESRVEEEDEEEFAASEKGSLMSEDPDDEDAEPDWLV